MGVRPPVRRIALALALVLGVACVDITYTWRAICRGDSTPAIADTSLVRCSTLDSLARRDSTP